MADFVKGGQNLRPPFGVNEFLRSTQDVKYESYTVAHNSVPVTTVFDGSDQKILDRGVVMAKITSGPDAGKIGPFQAGATDGRADTANIVGLNDTFLPWQLLERDVEVGVVYECTAVQGWCKELVADGTSVALTNATADAMRGGKGVDIRFH
ncbi:MULTISPECIES: hypothetical protein [Streptomyces]|uniref:hypothetical protein n=1 Tax=Streptomyces TaxID=1883 RepID=UPI00366744C5